MLRRVMILLVFLLVAVMVLPAADIPKSTKISVRFNTPISSCCARPLDSFDAVLAQDLNVPEKNPIKAGALVHGHVSAAYQADVFHNKPGLLVLRLDSLETSDATYLFTTRELTRRGKINGKSSSDRSQRADAINSTIDTIAGIARPNPSNIPTDIPPETVESRSPEGMVPTELVFVFTTSGEAKTVPKGK